MADRFSEVDGLPVRALKERKAPTSEVEKVRELRALWNAAKRVAQRRRTKTNENRRMLAGVITDFMGSGGGTAHSTPDASAAAAGMPQVTTTDIIPTNLFLRGTLQAKSEACDENWTTRCHGVGDLPPEVSDALVDDAETLIEKVMALGKVTREFSDSIDDSATIGPQIVKFGIGRTVVNRAAMSGGAQAIQDLVTAAANWQPGLPVPEPLDGMDYPSLSKAARDFVTPEQVAIRTQDQLQMLEMLAQASDKKWAEALDAKPEGYDKGDIWYRRVVYGDDVLWDHTKTTRWDDADWVGFRIVLSHEAVKKEESFKASARAQIEPVAISKTDGWEPVQQDSLLSMEAVANLNKWCVLIEWWDKTTGQVHYFTEEANAYDGFMERDSLYPHFDDKMRSILTSWFPMSCVVPVMHNLPVPERTQGIGWLEPGRPHAKVYVLADSALTASRKKAGRVIEFPADLPGALVSAILSGEDLVAVPRPAEMDPTKPLLYIHEFGDAPVDLAAMRNDALNAFAASIGLTLPEATGEASEPTLGQTVMAAKGPAARRNGLIRKMQGMAGDLAQNTAAMVRRYYSTDKVTELMGRDFTTPTPYLQSDPMNPGQKTQPIDPKTGMPAMIPSRWDIWRNAATPWDQWEVVFNPTAQGQDLMRAKAAADFSTQIQAMVDPITRVPYFDPRPLLEHQAKAMGFGRLRKFPVSPEQLAALLGIGQGPQPPEGGGSEGGEQDRSTPSGGNETSRNAGGRRGEQAVPHRQDHHEAMGSDMGDKSTQVHRIGAA